MFTSTRKKLNYQSKKCIEQGISEDGGLFVKDNYNDFKFDESFVNLSYNELALKIFEYFFDDFTFEELNDTVNNAYNKINFEEQIINIKNFNDVNFLELYYGPTLAFKDMALTILPHLMYYSKKDNSNYKKTLILTATSGDTGGAALSGFLNSIDTQVCVLYPTDGVSEFQEKQMQYYNNDHCRAIAIKGNFDDCQNLVKKVFGSNIQLKNYELSSANSINIGRLVPQIVYYFATYFDLVRNNKIKYGDKINFVVPTGNFGNILACYLAKKMGLFIDKLVCASNENNVLTEFFNTLVYDKNKTFKVTYSPAMDILISSNLERLLYLVSNSDNELVSKCMNELKEKGVYKLNDNFKDNLKDFIADYISNDETVEVIKNCYKDRKYLIDPHTAVAYGVYEKVKDRLKGETVVVSTASPLKFLNAMKVAFDIEGNDKEVIEKLSVMSLNNVPNVINKILDYKFNKTIWSKEEAEKNLISLIGEIDEKN